MKFFVYSFCLLSFFYSCVQTSSKQQEAVMLSQKDTCNNPDADINCSFINMPENVSHIMTIAGANEPGEPLIISGTITKQGGTPYAGVILYAYHTNAKGLYTKNGNERGIQKWHGHNHGWCKTDSNGYYEIHSIRPARYPDNSMPAHIHTAIKLPTGKMFHITDFVFKDDELVNEKYLSTLINNTGGTGIVDIKKNAGTWMGKRDIFFK